MNGVNSQAGGSSRWRETPTSVKSLYDLQRLAPILLWVVHAVALSNASIGVPRIAAEDDQCGRNFQRHNWGGSAAAVWDLLRIVRRVVVLIR